MRKELRSALDDMAQQDGLGNSREADLMRIIKIGQWEMRALKNASCFDLSWTRFESLANDIITPGIVKCQPKEIKSARKY